MSDFQWITTWWLDVINVVLVTNFGDVILLLKRILLIVICREKKNKKVFLGYPVKRVSWHDTFFFQSIDKQIYVYDSVYIYRRSIVYIYRKIHILKYLINFYFFKLVIIFLLIQFVLFIQKAFYITFNNMFMKTDLKYVREIYF